VHELVRSHYITGVIFDDIFVASDVSNRTSMLLVLIQHLVQGFASF
jgi:hypothetical protein